MKKIPKKVYSLIYLILFVILIVFSYNTSKKKADSVLELFTNLMKLPSTASIDNKQLSSIQ